MRQTIRPAIRAGWLLGVLSIAGLAAGGCSDDSPVPFCSNCEIWDQLTVGLARYPDPHPALPDLYVYSTIQKASGASDSQRESDEDIWLLLVVDRADPRTNLTFQLTGDEVSQGGDNFAPRWSPDGTQILFVHSRDAGGLEVWRVSVDASSVTATGGLPAVGAPEMLYADARDPEWISGSEIVFTRKDKLYRAPVGPAPGPRGVPSPVQLSFNPPIYASTEAYVDRHPDVAEDGGAVFNTTGRQPVGNIYIASVEPDSGGVDPAAFVLLRAPGTSGNYPLFEGADTLRTPVLLRSLPLDAGTQFQIGVRLDKRFIAAQDSLHPQGRRTFYCDTTLTVILDLVADATDSVSLSFEHARGDLRITSKQPVTSFSWIRSDLRLTSADLNVGQSLPSVGDTAAYSCLLSREVDDNDVPIPATLENYLITAHAPGTPAYDSTAVVQIAPAGTTSVVFFDDAPVPGVSRESERPRAARVVRGSAASARPRMRGGAPTAGLRAADLSSFWQLEFPTAGTALFRRVGGSPGLIQNPALSKEFPGRIRYVAYVTDESTDWQLYVQRLRVVDVNGEDQYQTDGAPYRVPTPGSLDNLSCERAVFHPRILPTSTGTQLRIAVGMGDCPSNGFEHLGFDDDPWALGEYRLWEVTLQATDVP